MQDQANEVLRRLRQQPPALQAFLLLTPFLVAAVVVLAVVLATGSRPAERASASAAPTPIVSKEAVSMSTSASAQAPTSSPVPAAAVLVPTPAATSTPEPLASPTPSNVYWIVNTEGAGASLRREPGASGQRVKVIPEGREVEALGPTREVDGRTWRSVRDAQGAVGWISTELLSNAPVDPNVTPTPVPLTIEVVDLTAAAGRGDEAMIAIRTRPGVRCEISVFLYGPRTMPREGLAPMTADDEGVCGWTWTVPEETVPGTWRYLVAVVIGDQRVTREVSFTVR
ncbi:MAG: hypothetical protein M3O34_12725 [Chloroflexota bacterium]|nr:hypothetical protein [Chloroflexota bacterium]